jgi:hypothetical protein
MIDKTKKVCDACKKLIRDGERMRLINNYQLHMEEFCFFLYTEKVKNGILRVPFTIEKRHDL